MKTTKVTIVSDLFIDGKQVITPGENGVIDILAEFGSGVPYIRVHSEHGKWCHYVGMPFIQEEQEELAAL